MIAFPLNWATGDKSQLVHEHAKRVEIILLDSRGIYFPKTYNFCPQT